MVTLSGEWYRPGGNGPGISADAYDSELEAVIAAGDIFNPRSIAEDREYLGAILRHREQYRFTVGSGQRGKDRISVRVPLPRGADIVAFWHTHGAPAWERRFFSRDDTDLALSWNRRFYLADHTGALRVFSPRDRRMSARRAQGLGLPSGKGFATGRIVEDARGQAIQVSTRLPGPRPAKVSATVQKTESDIRFNPISSVPEQHAG